MVTKYNLMRNNPCSRPEKKRAYTLSDIPKGGLEKMGLFSGNHTRQDLC
jgi:hypothetical protein